MPVNVINGPKRDSLSTEGGVMKGDIDMNWNKISNVGNPTSGGDVVTKEYLENNPPNINELPGILPISKGGTSAATKRAALNNLDAMPNSTIQLDTIDDFNTPMFEYIVKDTDDAVIREIGVVGYPVYVEQFFKNDTTSGYSVQIAFGAATSKMAIRYKYGTSVGPWRKYTRTDDLIACDNTNYPSVDYKLSIDGDTKAQVLANMERNIVYLRNWCTDTNYYENYLTPDPDTGRTKNGNYSILTTKETADYVVAQGTSGGWRYQKWSSGKAVCSRTISNTPTVISGANLVTVTLPFSFASTSYTVQITKAANGFLVTDVIDANGAQNSGHTAGSFIVTYKYSSGTAYPVSFNVSVAGSWK